VAAYATRTDLAGCGLKAELTADVPTADLDAGLEKRSRFADGYLAKRYVLPLVAWGEDLTLAVCQLEAWDVLTTIVGFNPDDAANSNWKDRRDEALAWLKDVAASRVDPVGIVDSSATAERVGPIAWSNPPRGY